MNEKKVRNVLSLSEKMAILKKCDESGNMKQCDLAKSLGITGSSLRTILSKRKTIEDAAAEIGGKRKKLRTGKYDDLEEILTQWFHDARARNIPLDGPFIQAQALIIAEKLKIENFSAANGWLDRFRKRKGILHRTIRGEAASVDKDTVTTWKNDILPTLISGYAPEDVFNADECALFYKLMPDRSLVHKGEKCHGGKLSKERLTVSFCANASGTEKLEPLIIGKFKRPRCFKHVKSFPCTYSATKNAWMTTGLFLEWMKQLNSEMKKKKRKILLFIDNCPAHPKDFHFSNIEVRFFPANCTSHLQPLDQGIIKVTKQKYRRRVVQRYLSSMNDSKSEVPAITVLDALHFLAAAWDEVSATTIKHCFEKAGFFSNVDESAAYDPVADDQYELPQSFPLSFEEYVALDDDVLTCDERNLDEIIHDVMSGQNDEQEDSEEGEEEETNECESAPNKIESLTAITTLRRYFSSLSNVSPNAFFYLNQAENCVLFSDRNVQTQITEYFS